MKSILVNLARAPQIIVIFDIFRIYHPDVLNLMSGHWTTNEPLKDETVNHLCTTIKHHMAGYKLCEELFKADFDISYHSDESDSYIDIEENLRKKYLLLPKVDGDESPVYFRY